MFGLWLVVFAENDEANERLRSASWPWYARDDKKKKNEGVLLVMGKATVSNPFPVM